VSDATPLPCLLSLKDLRFVHETLGELNDRVAEFDRLDRLQRLPEGTARICQASRQ